MDVVFWEERDLGFVAEGGTVGYLEVGLDERGVERGDDDDLELLELQRLRVRGSVERDLKNWRKAEGLGSVERTLSSLVGGMDPEEQVERDLTNWRKAEDLEAVERKLSCLAGRIDREEQVERERSRLTGNLEEEE